ncbi:MAG: hypothetical protein EP332_13120 [Bacteroidetes bacterium]|nr:MAG: hypothetical protein EP332_13120 [Bacteroidota bacterium]
MNNETILFETQENWGGWHAGDTTSIMSRMIATKSGDDTVYTTVYYYPNGIEKTKTVFVNDRLKSIFFVNDTNGNPYNFGGVTNGTGHVKQYDHHGILQYSGNYQNGNKEGWWYRYHFTGEIMDSTLYKDGFDISATDSSRLNVMFGLFRDNVGIRENWYQ